MYFLVKLCWNKGTFQNYTAVNKEVRETFILALSEVMDITEKVQDGMQSIPVEYLQCSYKLCDIPQRNP
jgi:hypothetical protein